MLFEKGIKGEVYNICSDKGESLENIINMIASILDVEVKIIICQEMIRPNDNKIVIGSLQKIKRDIEWEPIIPLDKSFNDIIGYWELFCE